ncbi:flagellar biosynthesis protein FlgM, partial [Streptomyces sp. SID4985]|nr:flagellar biosynthesis protein FlgM [Streptomyces sp. SID4985]
MAVAVAVTTAAMGLAGTALAGPRPADVRSVLGTERTALVVHAARAAAFAHAADTGVVTGDELQPQDVMFDPEGARHVRFTRTHAGLPVLGGDLVVHLDRHLGYAGVTRAADRAVRPATTDAKVTPGQAAAA